MFEKIKKRIAVLESHIKNAFPLFFDDSDGFLSALGVDPERYAVKNPDGSTGYDAIKALSDLAAEDWKE